MLGVEDRVAGVLFGLAAGDRIGGPIRMALAVGESLRDQGSFDRDDIGARYVEWWRHGAFDSGPIAEMVLGLGATGIPLEQAAIQVDAMKRGLSAGCNPAHRGAPIAMLASLEDSRLDSIAKAEALLTHRHPLAGDAAAAVVVLCRALIRGVSWEAALDIAAAGRLTETRRAIFSRSLGGMSQEGFAPDALHAALFFVCTSPTLPIALARSVDFAGVSNYCPVLVGSIGGARWGKSAMDKEAFAHHSSLLTRLRTVVVALTDGWAARVGGGE